MIKTMLSTLFLLSINISYANDNVHNNQRLFDTGEPINIVLKVGSEVMFTFKNRNLSDIAIKPHLQNIIHAESINNKLWIRAHDFFEPTKVLIKDQDGQITIFILSANINKNNTITKYEIWTEDNSTNDPTKTDITYKNKELNIVDLMRFAAQYYYAPKRLIKNIGLHTVPITINKLNVFSCQYFNCMDVRSTALASWSDGNKYISTIEIKNISNYVLDLDPRDLIGDFIASSFHFNSLGPHNSNTDTTLLYIVTNKPLGQVL